MMRGTFILVLLMTGGSLFSFGQVKDNIIVTQAVVVGADTFPYIPLREVSIFDELSPRAARKIAKYNKLVRDVKKTLPYAKLAAAKLKDINEGCMKLKTEKERNDFIKLMEKQLKHQFEDELKKLTITQGRILIKLIDRETGDTSYELIKELRGSFQAFLWQSLARLFGENLKEEYDANGADRAIEGIVQGIEAGEIK